MPNEWRAIVNAKCPYFERESKFSVTCEGIYKNTTIKTEFESEDDKIKFEERECFRYPNECIVQKIKNKIYDQE